jgi:TIR domain
LDQVRQCGSQFSGRVDWRQHIGPSTIGTDTLIRLGGRLSEEFLRGYGLGDTLIDSYRIFASHYSYHSCCISYSTENQHFADRLNADLQNEGVRCWFAPHNIKGGRKLEEQIRDAIHVYDRRLLRERDFAREIREYFIAGFSIWKDRDSYPRAFQRLVRDLEAEPTRSPANTGLVLFTRVARLFVIGNGIPAFDYSALSARFATDSIRSNLVRYRAFQ